MAISLIAREKADRFIPPLKKSGREDWFWTLVSTSAEKKITLALPFPKGEAVAHLGVVFSRLLDGITIALILHR
ncbi:MAG TPA: hypothetical protein VF452_10930 [Candidatus Binatia bacterium]